MGLALPLGILAAASAYQFTRRADLSLVLFRLCGAEPDGLGGQLAALLAEPLRVGAVGRFLQFPHLSVRSLDAAHLAGGPGRGSGRCPISASGSTGRGCSAPWPAACGGLYRPAIALVLLACSGIAYAAQPFVDHSNPDLTVMSFYEIPYAEGVTFVRRTAQLFPDTDAGTVTGRASYRLQNTSGREQTRLLRRQPGVHHLQRAGQRRGRALFGERLSGVQRGPAGQSPSPPTRRWN